MQFDTRHHSHHVTWAPQFCLEDRLQYFVDAGELWHLSCLHNTDWISFSGQLYLPESWIKADLRAPRVLYCPSKDASHILCSEYVGVFVFWILFQSAVTSKLGAMLLEWKATLNSSSALPVTVNRKVFSSSYLSLKSPFLGKILTTLEPLRILFHRV